MDAMKIFLFLFSAFSSSEYLTSDACFLVLSGVNFGLDTLSHIWLYASALSLFSAN